MNTRWALLAALLLGAAEGGQITGRSPYWLSDSGSITLTITGTGFSEDQFNQFDPTLGNRVILVNDHDAINCDVINYLSNTNKIVCNTRRRTNMGASRVYVIKVYVDGSETTGYATVEYASWRGPVIDRVIPAWSLPGAMVEYQGNLHTTKYLMIDAEDPTNSDPSKGAVITKVYMGGVDCEMVNATTGMLYVPLTSTRKLHCLVTSTYIGPMNTSVYVTDRGASSSTKWGMGVDSQDRLFQHHTYAAVESVSPDTSSSGGGALLTITGVGFDSNLGATEVRVGGAVCELQEITGENITCLSPPQHLTGPGSGERGLIFELWEGAYFSNLAHLPYWDNLTSTHPNYTSSVTLETRFDINLQAPSTGRIRGYIHAPHDGVYSLGAQLGKASIIYVATNGNPDNKTNVAHWQHLYLQKDTPAYMEIIFNSEESTFFRLMFNDFNSKFTSSQSYMASNERQQVRFKAGVRWETQRLTFEDEPGNAKLFLHGVTSSLLNVSDPNEVKQALLNMTEQLCEVLGDGPKFGLQAGYEVWETKPPGDNGNSFNEIEPFCGRAAQETRRNSLQLYYNNNVSTMVDANTYKYVCLALRGNVESMMSVRFYWKDKWNRNRDDTIWFNHNITSTPVTWTYKCLSLHDVVANSWMKNQHISGQRLLVKHVWAPKPSTSLDTVYVDEFALVDLDITVVQRRPSALKSLGILVTEVEAAPVEGVNNSYDVSFITSNCAGDFPLLGVFTGSVNTSWLTELAITDSASFEVGVGQVTVNRQVVATHSVGGTWDLLIQGKTIAGISSTVDKQELSTKIETGLGGGRVAVSSSGTCYKRSYQLEWLDDPGMKDLVEVEDTGLVFDGETLEVEIKRTGEGKIWHDTLHVDFLTTWREEPQVVVTVNKYTAACLGDCSLTYDDSLTPTMSTVSGSVDGTGVYTITVTGSGFTSTVTSDYRVTLGGNECTVTTVTPTQVTCTVKLHAGEHDVTLTMQPIGAALTSSRAATTYTVPLTVSAITPTTGGTGGGYTVVVSGTGFPSSSTSSWDGVVMLGGAECVPVGDADGVSITCLVSAAEASVVDVVVTVGSLSATLPGSFTYDASLSASLTSASPSLLSVTGGQELVISGSSFGSGTDGYVKVGSSTCEVVSWDETTITCTSPTLTPGLYPVTVYTGAQGFASGDVSVTYTLVITGSSVLKGSVNGGTIVVLKGQGFGTNCSLLEVDLGDSAKCEVTDCSDTEVTCAVLLTPVNHVVTNMGTDPSYGVGFAWSPRLVEAREGDSMTWQWNKKDEFSTLRHNVFQSASSTSFTYDGSGFHSGSPTPAGSMTVYFPHEGTYYYAGDPVSDKLVMSGQINVVKPGNHIYKVTLTLGGVAAEFNPSGDGVVVTVNGCVPILLEPLNGCTSTAPSPPDAEHLYFVSDTCFTPVVTRLTASGTESVVGVSAIQVRSGVTLTIEGEGFGASPCQTLVTVGPASCTVSASSDDSVTCVLDDLQNILSVRPYPVLVTVLNRGNSLTNIVNFKSEGQVTVVPVVTSFEPTEGSVAGGTTITITGTGLKGYNGVASVRLGAVECQVTSISATTITCTTTPTAASTVPLSVYVSGVEAVSDVSDSTFSFTEAATPTVSGVSVSGDSITITGLKFGTDDAKVTVTLNPVAGRRRRSVEEEVEEEEEEEDVPREEDVLIDDEVGVYDEDAEETRSSYRPKVQSHLFDKMDANSAFWGHFTKTSGRTFTETKKLGAWRVGGTNRATLDSPDDHLAGVTRVKRQADPLPSYDCSPTSVTDTTIICDAPGIPAGNYDITVAIEGLGDASVDSAASQVTVAPEVTSLTPAEGSVHGGALLTIAGTGFNPGEVSVTLDGAVCHLETETTTSLTCRTSAHTAGTVSVTITSGTVSVSPPPTFTYDDTKTPGLTSITPSTGVTPGTTLTLEGSNLQPSGTTPEVLVDGTSCTVITASLTAVTCTTPDLVGGSHGVIVRDSTYGDSNEVTVSYVFSATSVTPSTGSFGGSEVTVTGEGFDPSGGSSVTFCGELCDPVNFNSSTTLVCVAPAIVDDGSGTKTCDIVVTNPDGSTNTLTNSFTYDASLTPVVTAISPVRGGTAGGTLLTITGTGFAASGNKVTIGGSECVVNTETTSQITCTTEAHQGPGYFPVLVDVPSNGLSTSTGNDGTFFYIDRWSSIYTWGGGPVPSEGQLVVIEEGQTILLDQSTEVLKMLLIKGGHVVFDQEAQSEITLKAEYILIVEGGSLNVGSEDDPYLGQATIELHGNTKSIELPHFGAKVLAVREGSLALHGAPVPVTWTHLASEASPGDTSITLKQPVTWKAGDQIVIATTERRFMKNENEVRTIDTVSGDGRTITLTEALEYQHISREQTLGGRVVETRAEVGLLTRNIKIRGAINSDFTDTIELCDENWNPGQFQTQSCFNGKFGEEIGSDQFGAVVMIFGKYPSQDLVSGRIEYVEVTEAGQAFQLGRYPLHFHLVGNVSTSYIRGCAVHHTYNRAITIHAADYLTIQHNVVYDNMGHAIFTEDGIEQHNVIQYNLAIYTRSSSSLLNVDVTPSSFWVVNPNNIVRHNAAAGGTHFGYWYRLERHPSGPSATTSYCQNNALMGEFYNNTAHSLGRYGLWIFSMDGYFPKTRDCGGGDKVAAWHDFTVWRCDRGAEAVIGGALQFHNFVALDNQKAGLEMVEVSGNFGLDDGAGVFDSLVVGYSSLTPEKCDDDTSGIVAPKKYRFSIANTTFVNYDNGQCAALSGCSQCKVFQGGFKSQVKGLSFVNSPNKLKFKWEHETVWVDADGSLSGSPENSVVPSMGILPPSDCQMDVAEFSVNPAAPGSVCSDSFRFLRFNVKGPNIEPESLKGNNLVVSNTHGNTTVPYMVKRLTTEGWMGILYTGETYGWSFDDSAQITNFSYTAETRFVDTGDYYYVQHEFIQRPDGFSTTNAERNSSDTIPDSTTGFHGDYYWNNDTRTMTYLVSNNVATERRRSAIFDERSAGSNRRIDFGVYRCKYTDCILPTPPPVPTGRPSVTFKWSDVETWKEVPVGSGGHPSESVYGLPVEGDEIVIPQGMWVTVDTVTPPLGRVRVYGTLEFEDTMDHVFNTTIIYIQGGSVVAGFSEESPFTNNLNIVLRGTLDPNDPDNVDMPMPNGVPSVGWKAVGVFGQLSLHGQVTGRTWVKLGVTATAGDSQLTLAQPASASWLNKEVMVTATGKEALETEVRTVTGVSGSVLTLDSPLSYDHLGETHTVTGTTRTYTLAGEVGLLTHNIVIEGNDYPDLQQDSFGARILVSRFNEDGVDYVGRAKLFGVEFKNVGQFGFTDTDDPRFSLAFHGVGVDDGSNYVKKCSFNVNYNAALGFFGSDNITVESSVVYHTVGSGIRDDSADNTFRDNLISVMLFPGTYNGREESQNLDWFGGFDLNKASGTVLEDNIVAGSEQAGYRTYGEYCEDPTNWSNNEVHSATFGVLLWSKGGKGPADECRRLNDFYAWRVWDTAFYMQHYASFILSDVMVVDSKLGVNPLVYSPPALTHQAFPKTAIIENSLMVGASPSYSCEYHDSTSSFQDTYESFHDVFWKGGVDDGNTGLLFASFMSSTNMAPKHKFNEASSYPALYGATYVNNVIFVSFGTRSCGHDVAILTNKESDDGIHPVFTSELTFVDTPEDNYLFFHRANLGRVNPSDCVDMDCDGLKKVVLQDMDGSLLGSVNATATSVAEHEWDGDRSHGVGDYRIPVSLKQRSDGSQIPASEKFPNKGIIRDESCTLMAAWQAWRCTNLRHRMLVFESLDSDTEIRRVSPIALIANPGTNGYVDLVNGPMDRGWCMGYTCQERISTFYSVVAVDTIYEMAMTGTPPQVIRFHLLHAHPSEMVVVRLFFPKTQRYDVYVDDTYVPPTNIDTTKYPPKYQLLPEDPNNPEQYFPTLTDDVGTNYLQRAEKFLHVVIRGGHVIDIKTSPVVILTTGLVVSPDEIYDENIVQNMADLLGVSSENIRVADIIREDSGRRRRRSSTETVQYQFEVGNAPAESEDGNNVAASNSSGQELTYDDLLNAVVKVVNLFQGDGCTACNLTLASLEVSDPVQPPKEPTGPATQEFGTQVNEGEELFSNLQQQEEQEALNKSLQAQTFEHPSAATLLQGVPATITTYTLFDSQPSISVQNSEGSKIKSLGHSSDPWMITATLEGGPDGASLLGTSSVPYTEGAAIFTDLFVDTAGDLYNLSFSFTYPDTAPTLTIGLNNTFRAREKKVAFTIAVYPDVLVAGDVFSLNLTLVDDDSGEPVEPSVLQGQTMTGSVELLSDRKYRSSLTGEKIFTAQDANITSVTLNDLAIADAGSSYRLHFSASVSPIGWLLDFTTDEVLVAPQNPVYKNVKMRVAGGRRKALLGNEAEFEFMLTEILTETVGGAFWDQVTLTVPSRRTKPTVSLTAMGSEDQLEEGLEKLCLMVKKSQIRIQIQRYKYTMRKLLVEGKKLRRCNYKKANRMNKR